MGSKLGSFALAIKLCQFRNLQAIIFGGGEAQFFFKCLLEIENIPVLAKNQRHHDPMISGAHLPVCTPIALKAGLSPARDIGGLPVKLAFLIAVRQCLVAYV